MHVTHDRDEALSLGDDLAIIVERPAPPDRPSRARSPPNPADRDAARLLGWSELGHGTAAHAHGPHAASSSSAMRRLPTSRAPCRSSTGPKTYCSARQPPDAPAGASLTAPIEQVVPTRPLARISLASDPPITALMLHRDLERLHLQRGEPIQAALPPGCVRSFPAT